MRTKLAVLMLALSLFLMLLRLQLLAMLLVLILLAYLYKPLFQFAYEKIYGLLMPRIYVGRSLLVSELIGEKKVSVCLELVNPRHGVLDLEPIQFYGQSKYLIDGLIVDPDVEYSFIYVKTGGKLKAYLKISLRGENSSQLRDRIKNICGQIRNHLKLLGIGSSVARYPEELLKVVRARSYRKHLLPLMPACLLGLLASYVLLKLASLYLFLLLVHGYITYRKLGRAFAVEKSVLVLQKNESMYGNPTALDVAQRARWVYNLLNSLVDSTLVLTIRRASEDFSSSIERESYRVYELGTALDKLSILTRAERLFTAAERRAKRKENYYKVNVVVLSSSHDDIKRVRATLGSMGLRMGRPYLVSAALYPLY